MFLPNYMILLLCMGEIHKDTWRRLYELAVEFRKLAPWEWMYDTDLFGVRNPQTGEVGYCCIMGREKRFLGMAVYRGRAGLASYEHLQEVNVDHPLLPPTPAFEQDCLMLSYNNREELDEAAHARIRSLGVKFRGRSHWPDFHDYSPGMVRWPIQTEAQAQFLLVAMEQAIEVAVRCREDQDLLDHVEDSAPCLLVRQVQPGGRWDDRWLPIEPFQPEAPTVQVNTLYLRSNTQGLPRNHAIWLADIFYFPNPVQEEASRPYLPVMLILVQQDSGMILGHGVFRPGEVEEQLQQVFITTVRSQGYLPERIQVVSLSAVAYWEQLCRLLDIDLDLIDDASLIDDIKLSLFGSMSL